MTLAFDGIEVPARSAGTVGSAPLGHLLAPGRVALLHPFGDTRFYRHGWNSWSPSGWRRLSERPLRIRGDRHRLLTADDAANDSAHRHEGSAVGALEAPDGRVLLLGALGLGTPRVGADEDVLRGRTESPGGGWYVGFGPEDEVFAAYAGLVAERLGSRSATAGAVWSSWYSYSEHIDEGLVGRTVDDLAGYPFDVVQLDDGWERVVGDWRANDAFPSGTAATAARIAGAGFRPGLWIAPLIALPDAPIARERPDLLVQDGTGAPRIAGYNWGGPYFALDTTRTEVREHLARTIRGLVAGGFSYLKLDFLYAGGIDGVRAEDVPRESAYRDALALVRAAAGEATYLLGCGALMLPSAGLLDGARVGPDVAPVWQHESHDRDPSHDGARNAIRAALPRLWLRRLYELDPDAVYLRTARNLLDADERQALADTATILGFRSTSDPIAWLLPAEREALRRFLTERPEVQRLTRYRWRIGTREVDLTAAVG